MKIIKVVAGIIILMVMILLTYPYHLDEQSITGNSFDAMEHVAYSEAGFPTAFTALFAWLIYWDYKEPKRLKLLYSAICLCFFVLSGRVVSIVVWPKDGIYTGWFFIQTSRIQPCDVNKDCETMIAEHTTVQKLWFWRLRITNSYVDKVIFVGPFAWLQATDLFDKDIGNAIPNKKHS